MSVDEGVGLPVATGRRSGQVLLAGLRRHPRLVLIAVVVTLAASVAAVLSPLLLGRVVDLVVSGGSSAQLWRLVAAVGASAVAAGVLAGVARRWCDQLGYAVAADLREEVLDHSLRIDAATVERAGSGDVAARVTEDVEVVNNAVEIAAAVFVSLVTVLVTMTGFAGLDWRMLGTFAVVFPIHALALRIFLPLVARRFAAERVTASARTQALVAALGGAPTVHAYGLEQRETAVVERASWTGVQAVLRTIRPYLWFSGSMNGAEAAGLSTALLIGFFLVRGGELTVGDVTAAALLFHRLFGPLGTLLFSFNDIQQAAAALNRLVGVIDLPVPTITPTSETVGVRPAPDLRCRDLRHAYAHGPEVVTGVSLDVPAGTSLAVVGESGAGKTTVAAILGGVFPATSGHVWVGDDELADLDPEALRQRVGVVTQEVHVFAGTLADDLRLAAPEADDDRLRAALELVGADGWVDALPEGLLTRVGPNDHVLTAAQAQQVALARIALRDPAVVILDEATAEAGSAGARELERSAQALLRGRTAVVVAHRLSQARACDQIAVMAHGRVVELGSHEALVARGGRYAELWSAWQS